MNNRRRLKFLLRIARQDARKEVGRLTLFMSSIVMGIAALVAINSFNDNLAQDIDREAAALLGADLVVSGNRPAGAITKETLDSLSAEQATEVELLSMAFLPEPAVSEFIRVKALRGAFPFYGEMETQPPSAVIQIRQGKGALVEDGLMLQHNLQIGDSIRIGQVMFSIIGILKNAFGSAEISSSFAPTVYINRDYLASTELIQPGSLVNYYYYYKLSDPEFPIDEWKEDRVDRLRTESMRMETVTDRQAGIGDAFDNLNYFLNLVAMVALLLGCIGVASSVFIYVKKKIPSIAIFRCLGLSGKEAFAVYFIQIFFLGILGVVTGALLGSLVQMVLPSVLSDFLPVTVETGISWKAIWQGFVIGLCMTTLFALLPLLPIRNVSPLRALRVSFEENNKGFDVVISAIAVLILGSLFLFLWLLTENIVTAAMFLLGLSLAFGTLYLVARAVIWLTRNYFPRHWNFVFRQGLANLFRPNNQTQILLMSIGLGTGILTTLFIVQGLLLRNVAAMDAGEQPNIFLFGIETQQVDTLSTMTKSREMSIAQSLPIVTMRLEGWLGKSKEQWLADSNRTAKNWAIHRETRATYRDYLDSNEKLVSGTFPHPRESPQDSIYISLADAFAEAMDVDLGDELVFNVQGARIKTYVRSIRKIDNANMRARFLVLFPSGVLEDAPKFHVLVARSPSVEVTANFRNEVVKLFPNVSVIDLSTILDSVNEILNKVSYIIQFMALFSIITGLIVLLSSLLLSKYQRIKESVLLRTLGASKKQIRWISATEYALLGGLSALMGILIALIAGYLMARFQLDLAFTISWWPIAGVFLFVLAMTVAIGVLNNREVVTKPPLAVLRKEVG